jgi:hypothetical protein
MKGLIRFALIFAVSRLLAPKLDQVFQRVAARVPTNTFVRDVLDELSGHYSTSLIRSFGEAVGDVAFGPSSKGKGSR